MKKRIFSMLLIFCLVLSMLPMQVLAENNVLPGGTSIPSKNEETPIVEEASASEEVSDIEEAPASEEVPDLEEAPASEEVPDLEEVPASEKVPDTEEAPDEGILLKTVPLTTTSTEQFSLETGKTYYFDLSSEKGNLFSNPDIIDQWTDKTLHYVPFVYVGTVNAYSLESSDIGKATTDERAAERLYDHSLFVATYNVSNRLSWSDLQAKSYIFGKDFDTNYIIRSLSVGSHQWLPATNEWDVILAKNSGWIKHTGEGLGTIGQDTNTYDNGYYTLRGQNVAIDYNGFPFYSASGATNECFRPALEVKNVEALGKDGLKEITLKLNGGSFFYDGNDMSIVCAGDTYVAPTGDVFLDKDNNLPTDFYWLGSDDKAYAVGDTVPSTVTTLTAQWSAMPPSASGQVWDGTSAQYFEGGSGTAEDPYQIRTAEQLALMSDVINDGASKTVIKGGTLQSYASLQIAYYKLTADIVLNDTTSWQSWNTTAPTNKWKPIGEYGDAINNAFSGTFDGGGFTVSGMYFNDATSYLWNGNSGGSSVGLFGVNQSATIKNVTVAESYVKGYERVGGIVGNSYNSIVENCRNYGTVDGNLQVGGVAGSNNWTLQNSQNYGRVNGNFYVGGVAGYNANILKVSKNYGTVSGKGSIGGVVGLNTNAYSKLFSCINMGMVSGTDNSIGGIVGWLDSGDVSNNFSPKGMTKDATEGAGVAGKPSSSYYYIGHILGGGISDGFGNSFNELDAGVVITPGTVTVAKGSTQQFAAAVNGAATTDVTWSVVNDDDKVNMDADGKLTVTADAADGTYYVVKAVLNSDSTKYGIATVTVPIPAAPTITTTSLSLGVMGTAYSQTIAATGYPTAMTWSVSSGSLPAGLSLSTAGVISGTPTAAGTSTFTVKAVNGEKPDATKQLSITVTSPITSVSVSPSTATVKKSKTQQFTATVTATGTTTDKSVKWSVSGGTESTINKDGLLTVGLTETATTLTVKAESTVDSSKYGTATVTVTAAPKTYTVTFDSDGGSTVDPIGGIEEGKTTVLPATPTKDNYRFDGWFTEKNGSGTQFTSLTPVNSSITVYAKWTKLVTVKGVVVNYDDTPIQGAKVTLSPAYGTLAATTDADGKFSFANIPEDSFTATATFTDTSTVNVNITSDYGNVKIVKPKTYITINTQPQDATLVKGIAGQSAVFTIEGTRTPYITDKVGYQWYWQKSTIPDTMQDEVMTGSGSQMTLNQDNDNIPDRGTYKLYGYAYDADEAIEAYSRTATLKVVGTNTIEGVVKMADGTPVLGATVELEYAGGDWPYGSVAMTDSTNPQTTLTDGKYKFELVPDGKYKLIIILPEGGKIIYGPYDFPGPGPVTPPSPIDPDIVIPDGAKIQVNGQPQDATVKNGTAVTLSVDAASTDGTALTYQWYSNTKNANSGGTAIEGATASTYMPSTSQKGTGYYYCVVSGGSLTAATTRTAKVTVFTYGIIQGTVQTKEKQPIAGATVELINIDTPVKTGFTTSTNPQTTLADGKYKFVEVPDGTYKLKITLPGTDPQIFVVEPINIPSVNPDIPVIPPDKPMIRMTKQPKSMTVALHDTAEFTVGAGVSTGGTVLYQWYSNTTNSSSGGTAIDGATSKTYNAPTNTKGITYYYCVVQATDAEAVTSNIAKLTVRNTPVNNLMTIEGDVVDDNGSKIENAEVTLSPQAGTSENPQTTKADGHYKFENLPDGSYTITVKLPGGGVITKKIIIADGDITPTPPNKIDVPATNSITISKQPQSIEVTTEKTADFTAKATATKADVTYQWYKSTTNTNSGGEKLEGKTGETLSLDKQPEGISYYYCEVTSTGAPDKATDAAKLTVTKASGNSGDLKGKIVEDVNGDTVKDATVKLMKNGTDGIQFGSEVKTGEDGKFEFKDIPYGSYSLVAEKDTSMVTRQITIRATSTSENLTMPSGAKVTKMVIGDDTPSAAVENLESMFTDADNTIAQQPGATVEIKLVIEKQDTPSDGSDIDAALTENQHVGIYLNAKLVRTISGTVSEDGTEYIQPHSGQTLRIVLDLDKDLQGKTGYKVIRSHTENGMTDVRMITPDVDSSLQTLSFDADAFSTYAVVYTQAPKYSMTVIDSQAGAASGTGLYEAGETVTIKAGDKSGYTFDGWTTTDGVSFQSANSSTTTFSMPANNVTVTAKWKSNGGDNNNPGGGNNNPGGGNNTPGGDNNNPGGGNNTPGGGNTNPGGDNNNPGGGNNIPSGGNTTPGGDNITSGQENTVASVSNTTSNQGNTASSKGNTGTVKNSTVSDTDNSSSNKGNDNADTGNNSGVTNNLGDSSSSDIAIASALSDAKNKALQQLADERQKAIDALPDSLSDEKRQAALDEIDRIYNDAIKAIQEADSTGAISDTTDQTVQKFTNEVAGVYGKVTSGATAHKEKPFALLSAALAVASVLGAVLIWRRKEDEETNDDNSELERSRVITLAAAAVTILLFLLTTGWHGITFANWWTIAVAVPSVGSLIYAFKHK